MGPRIALRLAALAGLAVVLLQEAVSGLASAQPRQGWGFVVLVLAVPAVALAVALLMPGAGARLLRHPDLLVPLGLLTFADAVLGWFQQLPVGAALLAGATPVEVLGIGLSLSAGFLASILLRVAYAAWETTLILNTVRADQSDPLRALPGLGRWFLRVLGLEAVGWVALFAGVAVAVALGPVAIALAVVVIGAWSLVWNLATAALLLRGLDAGLGFPGALARGIATSRAGLARWWPAVVAQLLLLGLVTFYSVSYTETGPGSTTTHRNTNWSVNGFWVGGYESGCRWYDKLMEAVNAPRSAFLVTALGLVFGSLAIVVKLHIAALLPESPGAGPGAGATAPGSEEGPAGQAGYRPAESFPPAGEEGAAGTGDEAFRPRDEP